MFQFLTCRSAATWRINVYQIGSACTAQKLHIILKVSDHLFLPVCCLII